MKSKISPGRSAPFGNCSATRPPPNSGRSRLKTIRDRMIKDKLSRTLINQRIGRIRQAFKWAVSEELVPPSVTTAWRPSRASKRGRTDAVEREPVKPVAEADVKATLPFLPRHVAGAVRFQLLTGCRPGEACSSAGRTSTRPARLALSTSRPQAELPGKSRVVAVGPRAQAVLAEFPTDRPDEYVFSPARGMPKFARYGPHAEDAEMAVAPGTQRPEAKGGPAKGPGEKYDRHTYNRAIDTAVARANARRLRMAGQGNYDPLPHWHPNQLRHAHGRWSAPATASKPPSRPRPRTGRRDAIYARRTPPWPSRSRGSGVGVFQVEIAPAPNMLNYHCDVNISS